MNNTPTDEEEWAHFLEQPLTLSDGRIIRIGDATADDLRDVARRLQAGETSGIPPMPAFASSR